MKKYYFLIVIMVSWLYSCSKEPIELDTLIQEINNYRASKNISPMQKYPSLTIALQQMIPKKESGGIITNKDSVRTILKSMFIYDYQLSVLALNYHDSYNLDKLVEDNLALLAIIQNPKYNKINYLEVNKGGEKYLLFIAVQNFIDFNENLLFESSFLDGGGTQDYVTLSGETRAYPLRYALNSNSLTTSDVSKLTLNDVKLKDDGRFIVKVDLTKMKNEKLDHIVFFDNTGEIIANFKLHQND